MKIRKLLDSFNYAIDGIIYAFRTQRNMRIHFIVAILVLIASFVFNISKIEFIALCLSITMVMAAELVNTAIESAIDLTTNHYHPLAKIAKNTAAAAVLLTAINAVIVGYVIFWDELSNFSYRVINVIRTTNFYVIFIVLVIVCLITLIAKAMLGEGTPLKGGMPSGHSALAFSIATCITLISGEPIIFMLSYFAAFITAQSRVDSKVHSIWEVIIGALIGTLVTILIFKIF